MLTRELIVHPHTEPCNINLFPGGPKTVAEAKALGVQECPHIGQCKSGFLHPKTGHQCVMRVGIQVARYVVTENGTVDSEMAAFEREAPRPTKGWVTSKDRATFEVVDQRTAMERIRAFATNLLGEKPEFEVGERFEDVVRHATDKDGNIDPLKMEALEGRFGNNGGVKCDTNSGPCSCGAWH